MVFLTSLLFRPLCLKIDSNTHFEAFFLENLCIYRKNIKCYSILKNIHTYRFQSKLMPEICQKVRSFVGKMQAKLLTQDVHIFFSLEKQMFLKKKEKFYLNFYNKNAHINTFTNIKRLCLKMISEIYQKVTSLDLRTA